MKTEVYEKNSLNKLKLKLEGETIQKINYNEEPQN